MTVATSERTCDHLVVGEYGFVPPIDLRTGFLVCRLVRPVTPPAWVPLTRSEVINKDMLPNAEQMATCKIPHCGVMLCPTGVERLKVRLELFWARLPRGVQGLLGCC